MYICKRIILRCQLLKTDPAFQAQQLGVGRASIDKIKYTHANIIFKGTVQRKMRATGLKKNDPNFKEK
jgi:hypothetical protein